MAAKRYRVIVFDRPGFGYSQRPRGTIWSPGAQAALILKGLLSMAEHPGERFWPFLGNVSSDRSCAETS